MPEVDHYPPGAPCWMDLVATDRGRARSFYSALFGWDISDGHATDAAYLVARQGGRTVAGISEHRAGGPPPGWLTYFSCLDAGEVARRVIDAGGDLITAPIPEGRDGAVTVFRDPSGATAGGWQPGRVAGAELDREPGARLFTELRTPEVDAAADFYTAILPLDASADAPVAPLLRNLRAGGRTVADILETPATDPVWLPYFAVADTDDVAERTARLGGRVVDAARDSPYGRWARLADSQGANFCVVGFADPA